MTAPEMLASCVPNYIRREAVRGSTLPVPWERYWNAAVLLADISGFTRLSERLAQRGPIGVETLTRTLNEYFGCLVDLTMEHGGDVIQFQGDALLAFWPVGEDLAPSSHLAVAAATQCALRIEERVTQLASGNPVLPGLKIRFGIGYGRARSLHVGGMLHRREHVLIGNAVDQAILANKIARPGEVVLTRQALRELGDEAGIAVDRIEEGARVSLAGDPEFLLPEPTPSEVDGTLSERIRPFVPAALASRLDAGHSDWIAEIRKISALFITISGIDYEAPLEDWQRTVATIQDELYRCEGSINKLSVSESGSLFLVGAFGLPPLAHDNDPVRALHAAVSVSRRLKDLKLSRPSVGIATGRAFTGVIGNEHRREYTIIGDVVNTAARLAQAEIEGTLCDEATYLEVKGAVQLDPPKEYFVKGKELPVKASHVPQGSTLRVTSSRLSVRGQLIGREPELAAIQSVLETLRRRQGRTVLIEAEGGLGKSRLLEEVKALAAEREFRVVEGGGSFMEKSAPYHCWRSVFAEVLGIGELDDPASSRKKILASLPAESVAEAALLNVLFPNLDLPDNEQTERLAGSARAERTRSLMVNVLRTFSDAGPPLVLIIEDVHWLDSASWTLCERLTRQLETAGIILAGRPIREPAPEAHTFIREGDRTVFLPLGRLSEEGSTELICSRLGIERDGLPAEVGKLICGRAQGHPFFLEELTFALRDSGIIVAEEGICRVAPDVSLHELEVPHTVQGVVTSRIDQLTPSQQLALKVASVIGMTFGYVLLRDVHPIDRDRPTLAQILRQIQNRDLTVIESAEPDLSYAFKHFITREVTYNLMLYSQRQELHSAVGRWYEQQFETDLSPHYALLAHHWFRAGELSKAVEYIALSTTQTFAAGLGNQAVELGLEGARMLGYDLPSSPEKCGQAVMEHFQKVQELLAGRNPTELLSLEPLGDHRAALFIHLALTILPFAHQTLQAELYALLTLLALEATLEFGNGPEAPAVYSVYAAVYRALTKDSRGGIGFSELALELDSRTGEYVLPFAGFVHTWFLSHWINPIRDNIELCRRAIERADQLGDVLFGSFLFAAKIIFIGAAGHPLGDVESEAERGCIANNFRVANAMFHCVHERQLARALAGKTRDRFSFSDDSTDEDADIASICQTMHYNQIGTYFISKMRLHYLYGDYDRALEWGERAIPMLPAMLNEIAEWELALYNGLALYAKAESLDGNLKAEALSRANACKEQVSGWARDCPANFEHLWLLLEAESLRAAGSDPETVARLYSDAAAKAESEGFVQYAALANERFGQWLFGRSDPASAIFRLKNALQAYEAWGAQAKVTDLLHTHPLLSGRAKESASA